VHNPKLVHAADPLGRHFTPGAYSLTEREREIAVLVINSRWRSDYPTAAHERRGKEVGLAQDAVEAIIAGQPASFTDPREQVIYEAAMVLANERIVPEGLYERAVELLGHERITDMIVLMGYYTAVSLTMNFYAVPANSPGSRADPGSSLIQSGFGRCRRMSWPGDHQAYFLKKRLQCFGNDPSVFHYRDTFARQARRGMR
jgi:4-carboxymuconolactone decarboxylase